MPVLPSTQGRAGGSVRGTRLPSRRRRAPLVFAGPSSAAAPSSSSSSQPSPILAASGLAPTTSAPSSSPLVDRLGQVPVVVAPPSPDTGAGGPPPPPPAELPPPGGDGDGDGGDGGGSVWSRLDLFSRLAAGVRARSAADPAFAYKLAVECGLDAAIILGVNAAARGWSLSRLGAEAEFVLSQVAVSLLNDFALVYLLAPTVPAASAAAVAAAAAAASSARGPLRSFLASLPAHVLQRGPYPPSSRAACFAARAAQYGAVGFTMGVTGSALVAGLTALREAADPAWRPPPTYQSVLGTGVGWLVFMSTSSNVRYNLVNAAEEALYGAAAAGSVSGLVPRAGSVALRLANNVAGARGWMATAEALKLEQPRPPRKAKKRGASVDEPKKASGAPWGLRRRAAVAAAA